MLREVLTRDLNDPRFQHLYLTAFPESERIPLRNIQRTFGRGGKLRFYFDSDEFVGFTFAFETEDTVFFVYLAVVPGHRGKGYGTDMLSMMAETKGRKRMFLVLEKVSGEGEEYRIRKARRDLYLRNGWHPTGTDLLSDGCWFESMYIDSQIPEDELLATVKYYEEVHTGERK